MSALEDILEHHGIKGMHWGVRRSREEIDVATSQVPGKRVKATGGQNQPAHDDAVKAATLRQKARKSTTDSLSTQELQTLVNRMNLEANYKRLSTPQKSRGAKFANDLLNDAQDIGRQQIKTAAAKKVAAAMANAAS